MTPPELDVEVVGQRLRQLRQVLDDLESLRGVTAARLREEPLTRAAAERLVQVAVDLAVEVNAHVAVVRLGRAPNSARASFGAAAEAGILGTDLAERLAPAAGLRNVLVHRYTEIDPVLVADAVGTVLDGFSEYVRVVSNALGDAE